MSVDVVCVASFNADLVSRVARPLARGETVLASGFDIQPGGKGSNAAIACARQGARVAVLARLGDDDFGRMALALWAREGIDASAVEVASGERSGVAQILVYDDGDNSIAVAPGAGAALDAGHARAATALLRGARVVMASCEVPLAVTLAAFALAREGGAITLLNPAPARPLPPELLALTDLLTPNETELKALAGVDDTEAAARALLAPGPARRAGHARRAWRGAVRARPPAAAPAGSRRSRGRHHWRGRHSHGRAGRGPGARRADRGGSALGQCGRGAVGDGARRDRRHADARRGGGAAGAATF